MGKAFGGVLLAVVIISVGVYSRFNRKNEAEGEVHGQMQEMISKLPEYPANREYLDELLKREHHNAFEAAFTMGGRRTRSKFDWNKYTTTLMDRMCGQCAKDKKKELAVSLRSLEKILNAAMEAEKKTSGSSGG